MIKVELHTHTSDDPQDLVPHSTTDLIDRAAALGYGGLAVTLHDRQLDLSPWEDYASDRGVVLIPGVERTIGGRHLLLLNFPAAAESVSDFDEVRALKKRHPRGLVIAPHPFYPSSTCLRGLMDVHRDVVDAVEFTWFYTRSSRRFNDAAVRWAERHGLPVVGNGDVHRLTQLGRTYSLVHAEPSADAIVEAVREGRVRFETRPVATAVAAAFFASLVAAKLRRVAARTPQRLAIPPAISPPSTT